MKRGYCEKESEIIAALRGGTLDDDLEKHASGCGICADTLAVSAFLLANTAPVPILPDCDSLWWKAQLARKQAALERATRSIALVRKVSYSGVAAAALWLLFAPGHLGGILGALSKHAIWPTSAFSQSALLLAVAALVFTFLGSLYLVRPDK